MSKLDRDITRARKRLTDRAKIEGLWENFGEKEIRILEEKYDKLSLIYGTPEQRLEARKIEAFEQWCMNFTL